MAGDEVRVVTSLADLLATKPDILLDCGGQAALGEYGEAVLAAGCDLLSVATGAMADQVLAARLEAAAASTGRRLLFPAGALAGIDGLLAARHGGLTEVTYSGRKPVNAWRGTAAEAAVNLDRLVEATVFFIGNAREAAGRYPMNANVAATIALAGIGFERTTVRLIADPQSSENLHELSYKGAFGAAEVRMRGRPSTTNPRTSALTAFSLWQALLERAGGSTAGLIPGA